MIEAKDLNKHPIRYATQYLSLLLAELAKPKLIEEITFSVRSEVLLITCKNDEAYQVLKQCETLVDKDFIAKLGLKTFLFQYDKYYLVLKIVNELAKLGLSEITFDCVLDEVNKYSPSRTAQSIKNVLAFFAYDLSQNSWRQSTYSKDLISARGLQPLLKRLKNGNYQLLIKVKANKLNSAKNIKNK